MLQQLINDVCGLASVVSDTASFWNPNPSRPISSQFARVLELQRSICRQCSITLNRFATMLALPVSDVLAGIGTKVLDMEILGWKVNTYAAAVQLVLGTVNKKKPARTDVKQLEDQAQWFQYSTDQLEGRGKTDELLMEEVLGICDHLYVLGELQEASTRHDTAHCNLAAASVQCSGNKRHHVRGTAIL
ncbi:hypothetical protein BDW62DRAFT_135905 [Aspergillus aurantiobrunneus]